jgi:NADPH:quinone reductase-like Zn-dependent oxidoreductase
MLAVQGLIDVGQVDAGKRRVLLNGAGGGVGTFALQLLRDREVHVTCVDRADKLEALRELGADHLIDYEAEDFTSSGEQYDLILDTKTNRSPFAYLDSLAPGGIYATVGGSNPRLAQTFLLSGHLKRRYGKEVRIVALKPNKDLAFMNREFESGRMVPIIDSTYELADAAEAIRRLVAADHIGKVIIRI